MVESVSATMLLPSRSIEPNSVEPSRALANSLKLKRGDHVTIHGKRLAVAPVGEIVNGEDFFLHADNYTRESAGATLNSTVEVTRVERPLSALRVVFTIRGDNHDLDSEELKSLLLGGLVTQGQVVACHFDASSRSNGGGSNHQLVLTVLETRPCNIVKIMRSTRVIIANDGEAYSQIVAGYDKIGGLAKTIERLRVYVAISLSNSATFSEHGTAPYRGILLIGSPGVGKTLTINALQQETGAYKVLITADRLLRDGLAQACTRLKEKFVEAKENSPAIIVFEKIDRICKRSEGYGSPELDQLATTLANEFDNLGDADVIVIASANSRETIDPILLTAGRFDKEIIFDAPNEEGRIAILRILTRDLSLEDDVNLQTIAERTHGFTGADLDGLCSDALYESIMRQPGALRPNGELAERARRLVIVSMRDFAEALKTRKASCGRAYIRETAKVAWDQVGGIDDVKAKIAKDVIAPNRYRQLAVKLGVRAPTGIIFHGPPGTGKTYLAKAIATQLGWTIISKRAAELVSKYLGETQRNIDDLFQAAIANAPVVVHIDEADSIAPKRVEGGDSASRERSSAVNTLLEGIDRIVEAQVPVLLIFTTNRIDILDDAFLRSGRVESHYYVGPPDQKGREEIFDLYGGNYATGKIDYHKLADVTEEFTPADIKWVWEEASRARFAASILKHESRSETSPFLKDLLEGKTPEAITEPHANIEVSPITMPDLLAAINLRTEKTERRS